MVVVVVLVVIGEQELDHIFHHPSSTWTVGFTVGAAVTSAGWLLWMTVIQLDGSWSWRVGAQAERWTAAALQKLGSRWRFAYNVVFYGGKTDQKTWVSDIDCLAVGPPGVLAVSTKWTGDTWNLNDSSDRWVAAAAHQAAVNADRIERPIRARVPGVEVIPVVVCWGPHLPDVIGGITRVEIDARYPGPVRVVNGNQADIWRLRLTQERLSDDQIADAYRYVVAWIESYEDVEGRNKAAQANARASARRAKMVSVVASVIVLAAMAVFVVADHSRRVTKDLLPFVRFGGGLGAFILLVIPTISPILSLVVTRQAKQRCERAQIEQSLLTQSRIVAVIFGGWVLMMAILLS